MKKVEFKYLRDFENTELYNIFKICIGARNHCPNQISQPVFSGEDILLGRIKQDKVLREFAYSGLLFSKGYSKYLTSDVINILIEFRAYQELLKVE